MDMNRHAADSGSNFGYCSRCLQTVAIDGETTHDQRAHNEHICHACNASQRHPYIFYGSENYNQHIIAFRQDKAHVEEEIGNAAFAIENFVVSESGAESTIDVFLCQQHRRPLKTGKCEAAFLHQTAAFEHRRLFHNFSDERVLSFEFMYLRQYKRDLMQGQLKLRASRETRGYELPGSGHHGIPGATAPLAPYRNRQSQPPPIPPPSSDTRTRQELQSKDYPSQGSAQALYAHRYLPLPPGFPHLNRGQGSDLSSTERTRYQIAGGPGSDSRPEVRLAYDPTQLQTLSTSSTPVPAGSQELGLGLQRSSRPQSGPGGGPGGATPMLEPGKRPTLAPQQRHSQSRPQPHPYSTEQRQLKRSGSSFATKLQNLSDSKSNPG